MNKYKENHGEFVTQYEFIESETLPDNLPVSTPLTFSFIGENVVLTKKETGVWDVLGGKVERGESWKEALKREALEEAGVHISNISIIGYVHAKSSGNTTYNKFPDENILPVTISFVQNVEANWERLETRGREAFKRAEAKEVLKKRNDNQQLLTIFLSAIAYFDKQNYSYDFTYVKNNKAEYEDIPTTQAMVFLRDLQSGKFVVVRDEDEPFFSLPGGGCRMDELDADCARREVMEEAQVNVENLKLIGVVIVDVKKDGEILSRSKHVRFVGEVAELGEFVPNKNGFETVERKLIADADLKEEVKLLQNKTGDEILQHIKKEI